MCLLWQVLGHESAGIISKGGIIRNASLILLLRISVGPNVKHLKVGDRVAIEPGATCRRFSLNCSSGPSRDLQAPAMLAKLAGTTSVLSYPSRLNLNPV